MCRGSDKGGPATVSQESAASHPPRWRRALIPLYATAVVVFVLDQITKYLILDLLGTQEGTYRRIIDDLLWLRLVHNSGAAFGMLRNASLLFATAAVAVSVGILLYSRRLSSASLLVRVSLGMELGGALGNLLDRVRQGYVVDFVDVRLWPFVFNVSDASITIGVVLLAIHLFFGSGEGQSVPAQREHHAGDRPV